MAGEDAVKGGEALPRGRNGPRVQPGGQGTLTVEALLPEPIHLGPAGGVGFQPVPGTISKDRMLPAELPALQGVLPELLQALLWRSIHGLGSRRRHGENCLATWQATMGSAPSRRSVARRPAVCRHLRRRDSGRNRSSYGVQVSSRSPHARSAGLHIGYCKVSSRPFETLPRRSSELAAAEDALRRWLELN